MFGCPVDDRKNNDRLSFRVNRKEDPDIKLAKNSAFFPDFPEIFNLIHIYSLAMGWIVLSCYFPYLPGQVLVLIRIQEPLSFFMSHVQDINIPMVARWWPSADPHRDFGYRLLRLLVHGCVPKII